MADFVETSIGWLNLDHVILIRYGDARLKEVGENLVQLSDGRSVICRFLGPPGQLPNVVPPIVEAEP
jgi:hypothetical protein